MLKHFKQHSLIYLILFAQLIIYWGINRSTPLPISGALYWDYARHLQFAYLDSPYMLPLIIKGYSLLFGTSAFAFAFLKFIFIIIITALIYATSYSGYGRKAALMSVVFFLILPANLYDHLSYHSAVTLFIACVLFCFTRWHATKRNIYIYFGGIFLGALLMTQFESILFVTSLAVTSLLVRSYRTIWRQPAFYLSLGIATLFILPFLAWQFSHHWITFTFLSASHNTNLSIGGFFRALLENIGDLGLFFFALPPLLIKLYRQCKLDDDSLLFFYLWLFYSLLLAVAFYDSSVRHDCFAGANVALSIFLGIYLLKSFPRYTLIAIVITAILYIAYLIINIYPLNKSQYAKIIPLAQPLIQAKTLVIADLSPADGMASWFAMQLLHQPEVYAYKPAKLELNHNGNPAVYLWQPSLANLLAQKTWSNIVVLTMSTALPPSLRKHLQCKKPLSLHTTIHRADSIGQFLSHGTHKKHLQIYAHQCNKV